MRERVLADVTNSQEAIAGLEKLPSIGSSQHAAGSCKRCCFFPRNRCTNGYNCEFCHFDHEKRSRRKRRSKNGQSQLGLELEDGEEDAEEALQNAPLQIQLPVSPDIDSGEFRAGSYRTTPEIVTPEDPAMFVQSCLCTMPAETQESTTSVPMYTPTVWGEAEQPVPASPYWNRDRGKQIVYGTVHSPARSQRNKLLPPEPGFVLPETAPLVVHQWQDAPPEPWSQRLARMNAANNMSNSWGQTDYHSQNVRAAPSNTWGQNDYRSQDARVASSWSSHNQIQADWSYNNVSQQHHQQQSWDWNMQAEDVYPSVWADCPLATDPVINSHMHDYMATSWNQSSVPQMQDYSSADLDVISQADSTHIPDYMPAIPCMPKRGSVAEDTDTSPNRFASGEASMS